MRFSAALVVATLSALVMADNCPNTFRVGNLHDLMRPYTSKLHDLEVQLFDLSQHDPNNSGRRASLQAQYDAINNGPELAYYRGELRKEGCTGL